MRGFRFNAARVLLTFSQTGHRGDISEIMGYHLAYLPPVKYYLLAHELHRDGGHHYHLVIVFESRPDWSDVACFDWMFDDVHPNIVPIRHGKLNMERSLRYCKKHQDYVESEPYDKVFPQEKSISRVMAEAIQEGKSDRELNDLDPVFVMRNRRMISDYRSLVENWRDEQLAWVDPVIPDMFSDWRFVYQWIVENVKPGISRDFRARNLWIWGQAGLGKSRLGGRLSRMVSTFFAPKDGWLTGYNDSYQLVVFDDFKGNLKVDTMNSFCQGSVPFQTPQKGLPPVLKRKNPAVIVTCNMSPEQVYHNVFERNPDHFNALASRFLVVQVKDEFDFWP